MRAQVEQTIQAIRPAIQADNGDIYLRDVDEDTGVVSVELIGACVSCPASTVTLKAGIERILKDRVPGVTEVINVGEEAEVIGGDKQSPLDPAADVSETAVSL
jgi:Fe-S cluster biogenesis protein NfuA